ncbi:DUF6274 family protein [Streptomyces sp. P9(2023)]|uniref:DUF6274 family protein n=1 Tax=Streptomyces sp. P9(2023) TaxID=3064394 RepID=UPI0028F42861|nr:DUF6274 family protein [Streptomyces sp. P9(2023)]MDT9691797.1 DUF6274 family protein [Streptomyces sp. P9(2023)]
MAAASAARHEIRALLRAHLAAASRQRHLTRLCPVCHRLQRLVIEGEVEVEHTEDESPTSP